MENNKLIKISAYLVGIATFLGFLILLFMPSMYNNTFSFIFLAFNIIFCPVGFLEAFAWGGLSYFIFKRVIENKLVYWIIFCLLLLGGFCIGAFSLGIILRWTARTSPYENTIDTNHDGKIDKWVYHNDQSTKIEIDTDFDGKPNTRECFENGDLVKKENITEHLQK